MTNSFRFHEDCNKDVKVIIEEITRLRTDSVEKFKDALVETYQRIYENPSCGGPLMDDWMQGDLKLNFVTLNHFSYSVAYLVFANKEIVILGVVYVNYFAGYRKRISEGRL